MGYFTQDNDYLLLDTSYFKMSGNKHVKEVSGT